MLPGIPTPSPLLAAVCRLPTILLFRLMLTEISGRLNLNISYMNLLSIASWEILGHFLQKSVPSVSGLGQWGCPQSQQLTEANFPARRCGELAVTWGYGSTASCNFSLYLTRCGMTVFDSNLGRWKKKRRKGSAKCQCHSQRLWHLAFFSPSSCDRLQAKAPEQNWLIFPI